LTLSAFGELHGTPTAAGTFTFTVTATDTDGATGSYTYTVTIRTPPVIITPSLATWTVNQPGYNQLLATFGGISPYTYTISAGTLPPGVTLSSGVDFAGTPTSSGSYTFTVTATDYVGATANHTYTMTINPSVTVGISALLSFGTSGTLPYAGLIEDASGNLFGTTQKGGTSNLGTVFEVPSGANTITTLASFSGTNGSMPFAGLVEDSAGNLFGTTLAGGAFNVGTVFELPRGSSTIMTIGTFYNSNGANPYSGLVEDSSGNLFGTTAHGGSASDGTVFELPNGSGTITTLATFTGSNGSVPVGNVVEDSSGNLYGTASSGGGSNYGTVFEVQFGSGTITTLATFNSTNGAAPQTGLILDGSGNLFGTTYQGGALNDGTVFEVPKGSGAITTLASFNKTNGFLPEGALVQDATGNLYGTTAAGGPSGDGTVFELLKGGSTIITLGSFDGENGQEPIGGLVLDTSGNLFGTTYVGGTAGEGIVFEAHTSLIGAVGVAYNLPLFASGGTGALSFRAPSGGLPPGLMLSSAGVVSGIPTSPGQYTLTVTATDTTGASGSGPVTIAIGGIPTKLAFATQPVSTPTGMELPTVTVDVLDAYGNVVTTDNTDVVTLAVASGPGSFLAGSTTSATVQNGVATFNNLTLVVPGSYTLSESVPTLYTGPNSGLFTVLPLRVASSTFTASGFTLQFNSAFLVNSLTPVLYGQGSGGSAPVPSVTLTQTKDASGKAVNNPIAGSLVLSTATNSATFVSTDTTLYVNNGSPILPDGTYTVTVHSSAANNGFQALNPGGGFLDGLGTGTPGSGDYTRTFTVNAAAMHEDVVWVPATADGPGEPLEAPGNNQVGGGFPIYLDSSGGVTSVLVTVNYNPALLTVTGASGTGFHLLIPSPPGHARFQYGGAALAAGGKTPIGFITATVPAGTATNPTPYKAKDLLQLSGISLNSVTVPAVNGDALHVVAYVGDADGNGAYSSNDAVLITRTSLQADTGFAAYPLVDPVIVADTDGAGFIPADAALQASEAAVGFPTANLPIPPIPAGVHFQAIANNVDPTLSLGFSGDGAMTVAVNIDNPHPAGSSGLTEAHLALTYDPTLFTVSAADVHLGSVLVGGGDWSMAINIDQATGQIGIALSSTTPISATTGGSLVTIDFHSRGKSDGPDVFALVPAAKPNGEDYITELEDLQGAFTITL
jgi:uncharacterized repeat protein (TIGR03803 family)